MKNNKLAFLPRDNRDQSRETLALQKYNRVKGKSLKHILIDRFLNNYGYDKGPITASAIVDDLLDIIERYYVYHRSSFLKQGQMIWHAVPVDEYPKKGKSIAQTKLKPVVLDIISDSDLDAIKNLSHPREVRLTKVERWTNQAYDQGALLSQLDLAVLLNIDVTTAGQYVREYASLYGRQLPTRGNIQLIGGGQTHKQPIIALHLKGYLVPTICQRTNHSRDAVERYIHDFESVRLLSTKFDDVDTISRIVRPSTSVVKQYLDLIPLDSDV